MADFNYGINCQSGKIAEKLFNFIGGLNIKQDGLDFSEERVSVISNSSLKDEIIKFSKTLEGEITIEIWPKNLEYDEAEEKGKIETYELAGKKAKSSKGQDAVFTYRSYSGSKDNIDIFLNWLKDEKLDKFKIVEIWIPQVEYGSYGVEFECGIAKYDKLIGKDWMKKGIILEKKK
jgi:hypothetical protein